ncbi:MULTISPECIES: HAD family hydrolase [unclassified Janthinobacterium]|uniref:D-glycero-alpha-D-manno-heptose-1,7-bisphosphate 7-phosphatase n=1 Tax=unclassified Janthinobacterium TaxID=2610881 RepID=UPI0018CB6363|nr:HAD family hydrolase [Janthinobacterium sp. CG_23.4]MDH6159385.1 D-glycero-D-manno-heptose 1,7-bisphosphate phosphatase [Janthinobacterium sp. CG_23.4]
MEQRRALFLDRDGVINHDSGYTHRIEDFYFIDGIFDLCRAAQQAGYLIIVVTNQAGIGRGYYTEEDFQVLTTWMVGRFAEEGVTITDVLYCPFHPEHGVGRYKCESADRKPNPGMLVRAARTHQIDLNQSIMVGDKDSDMEAATKAGVQIRCHYAAEVECGENFIDSTHRFFIIREIIKLFD